MTIFSLIILGLAAGFLGGLFGVGGGVLLVPGLALILNFPIHKAIGVSIAVVIAIALAGSLKHYSLGNVDIPTVLMVSVGGVIGSLIGAYTCQHIPADDLKRYFGIFLILIGLAMVFKAQPNSMSVENKTIASE